MAHSLPIEEFLQAPGLILDVRSPGEYERGHIPGAVSFALFNNAERVQVGICYKHQGQEAAVELGLEIVGPKLAPWAQQAKRLAPERRVRIHCWRGGMRSQSMAWLLETVGFEVFLLQGGYKAFRGWIRTMLTHPYAIAIVGGMTGTGKTCILQALAQQGEQVLDLEALAQHRGSSYGHLGLPCQPSTEQFENLLAMAWSQFEPSRTIWMEAENAQIGSCRIPPELFAQMKQAPIWEIQRSRPERVALLGQLYGQAKPEQLIAATKRIGKRLGPQRTQGAIEAIDQGDLETAISLVLHYYDRAYYHSLDRWQGEIRTIEAHHLSAVQVAQILRCKILGLTNRQKNIQDGGSHDTLP
jgi:tRNA 2-selenouridine synthase